MIDKLEEAVRLAKANPDLEIKIMVDNNIAPNNDYQYWHGIIKDVTKNVYWEGMDDYLIGEEAIKDRLEEWLRNDVDLDIAEGEIAPEVAHQYQEMLTSGEVRHAIFIYVTY